MKRVLAILIALAALSATALAYVPVIPDEIDEVPGGYTIDDGYYSFSRVVSEEDGIATPQVVYSGMLFGADETPRWDPVRNKNNYNYDYQAGVVANAMTTKATGVCSDVTRQYINQGGSLYKITRPQEYDPQSDEDPSWVTKMGFKTNQVGWVSGDVKKFTVDPDSFGAVGGNYFMDPADTGNTCGNAWLMQRQWSNPITVTASGDSRLYEAYGGIATSADVELFPQYGCGESLVEETARQSGYSEAFAGYDDAWVGFGHGDEIMMDIGRLQTHQFLEGSWGVGWDYPNVNDFTTGGDVNWPNLAENA